jgi:hypothetical protein
MKNDSKIVEALKVSPPNDLSNKIVSRVVEIQKLQAEYRQFHRGLLKSWLAVIGVSILALSLWASPMSLMLAQLIPMEVDYLYVQFIRELFFSIGLYIAGMIGVFCFVFSIPILFSFETRDLGRVSVVKA